ncbi:N-acetylmuramoyl-L-alanine amidase [Clostridium neonatale]|uniref:peptidoglycan recognition protein family protein n=1 Tax=Clostridium neonatale TaxID=137838 RepID=UPI00291C4947|nr:N-acetylmuramoyl-L-alanine amidase [Clostridium neonatale]CAI3227171.1 N-acetylmuramoyl-L-alanine amidase [Clostridium neonatale]CAI3248911.1 N-acetylmuramoyl-L-alanine amidase [Clostridium neonatale]
MNIIDVGLKFKSLSYGNKPNKLVLHHAEASKCTVQDIHSWHLNNGWSGIGYHYFIRKDGSIYRGRPDGAIGAHCQGSNTNTLGICFEGNYMKETMSTVQYNSGIDLIKYLIGKYGNLPVYGHKELLATECPGSKFPLEDFKQLRIKAGKWLKGESEGNTKKWWYKHSDGSYTANDWEKIDGEWYFFDYNGWMKTGWIVWKGKDYYLYGNGVMAHNTTLYGYKFDSNGVATKV